MIVHVLRKPLIGTVAQNALQHGCGALNIDECRIEPNGPEYFGLKNHQTVSKNGTSHDVRKEKSTFKPSSLGRWPSNLVHDGSEEVVGTFPVTKSGGAGWNGLGEDENRGVYGKGWKPDGITRQKGGDSGSAARFFQQVLEPKAPKKAPPY